MAHDARSGRVNVFETTWFSIDSTNAALSRNRIEMAWDILEEPTEEESVVWPIDEKGQHRAGSLNVSRRPGPRASAPFRPALASRTSHPRQRLGRIALYITGHAAQKTTSISTGE